MYIHICIHKYILLYVHRLYIYAYRVAQKYKDQKVIRNFSIATEKWRINF